MTVTSGKFITLEGGEGVGKTINLEFICDYLQAKDVDVLVTHEPGGTAFAEKIRNLLLDPATSEPVAEDTELLLMFASRAQHIAQKIKPAIQAGKWVVCSRFTDSSFAYQGGGRGIATHHIQQLADWVHGDFQPDITLVLDLPVEIGLQRARERAELDRIEQEKKDFFERVRQAFLARAKTAGRYHVIDANQSLKKVQTHITTVLEKVCHP